MTLQTIIKQRCGTALDWESDEGKAYVPEKGEACWYAIPVPPVTDPETGNIIKSFPDEILCKVGDGDHTFQDLPYIQAVAADVYAWAKQDEQQFLTWLNDQQFLAYNNNKYSIKGYLDEILFNTEILISAEEIE